MSIFEFRYDFAEIFDHKVFKKSDSAAVCMTPRSKNFRLSKLTLYALNLSFHDTVDTPP